MILIKKREKLGEEGEGLGENLDSIRLR